MDINELISTVCDCVYAVSNGLHTGFLESVYQNALCVELELRGIPCEKEVPINVIYKGISVGFFRADIIVDKRLIVELKVVDSLCRAHECQLVNYLAASGIEDGLLVNFQGPRIEIKRKFRTYTPQT